MIYKKGDSFVSIVEEELCHMMKFFDMVSVHKYSFTLTSNKYGVISVGCNDVYYKGASFAYSHINFRYIRDLDEYEISIANTDSDSVITFKFM